MDVSIIVVNYNTLDLTLQCLHSIYEHTTGLDFEIILVDNASVDGSSASFREKYPGVKLIQSEVNLGFGRANNLAAKSARGKYLLFLNPDCLLLENSVKAFFEFMEQNNPEGQIGAVGAMLFDKNMNINTSYHKFPTIPGTLKMHINRLTRILFHQPAKPPGTHNYFLPPGNNEVEFLTGADLFVPSKIFKELEGFDERFFMYYEETDLQKRMSDSGLKRIILKDHKIIHLGGGSAGADSSSLDDTILFTDSMFIFFRKNWNSILYTLFWLTVTPLLITPLFNRKFNVKHKKSYMRMLARNIR